MSLNVSSVNGLLRQFFPVSWCFLVRSEVRRCKKRLPWGSLFLIVMKFESLFVWLLSVHQLLEKFHKQRSPACGISFQCRVDVVFEEAGVVLVVCVQDVKGSNVPFVANGLEISVDVVFVSWLVSPIVFDCAHVEHYLYFGTLLFSVGNYILYCAGNCGCVEVLDRKSVV